MLAGLLWNDLTFTCALTGDVFPASRAVDLSTALHGARPDQANLNRTVAALPGLERTSERVRVRSTGRPSVVWAFRSEG